MAKKKKMSPKESSPQPVAAREEDLNFEKALSDVEAIVGELESGSLGLSESLQQYEEGIRQLKRCHQLLDSAEQRVSLLAGFDADGNPVQEAFSADSSPEGSNRNASGKGGNRKSARKTKASAGNGDRDQDDQTTDDAGDHLF